MMLLAVAGMALLGGMFVGAQIDDKLDKPTEVVGGGISGTKLPVYVLVPLVIGVSAIAFFGAKKLIKKI